MPRLALLPVWAAGVVLLTSLPTGAQELEARAQERAAPAPERAAPAPERAANAQPDERAALSDLVRDASVDGGARSYFMATVNGAGLQDWASWGVGLNLGARSGRLYGFGLGLRFYSTNALAGNVQARDSVTGRPSRYELGLYDVVNPESSGFALLGEGYLDFEAKGHRLWLGRHGFKSPLINPQDGRIIPTLVQGVWYSGEITSRAKLQLGYLSHIGVRSTAGFFAVQDSIGLYPAGRSVEGSPSAYPGRVSSSGVLLGSLSYRDSRFEAEVWDYFVEGVFNTVYAEVALTRASRRMRYRWGAQAIAQQRVGDGGSDDLAERYFEQDGSLVLGLQASAETERGYSISWGGNWISDQGRFLFPREWGREPLYVFQKRERSEGSGAQLSFLVELGKSWKLRNRAKLSSKLGYGHYVRPPALESALNKYGLPSLFQINLDTTYSFGGPLSGLSAELLVIYKGSLETGIDDPGLRLNKVDMMHGNFIVNYSF